ncbi:MAG: murein biosynthesis integral membrane protein MurJ, partial [Gammaproteobacteria bacterium]|nr:murein biosynthesis integral membrane protein MurJ [Gammaproteobacteria bacterium]
MPDINQDPVPEPLPDAIADTHPDAIPDSLPDATPDTTHGLLRASATVGSMTMLSRVLGLVRDVVIAAFVGASANADAFFVAFRIPNFLRRLFAEGAFSQAFVPVLADYKQ